MGYLKNCSVTLAIKFGLHTFIVFTGIQRWLQMMHMELTNYVTKTQSDCCVLCNNNFIKTSIYEMWSRKHDGSVFKRATIM